jgi:hypothetical protein
MTETPHTHGGLACVGGPHCTHGGMKHYIHTDGRRCLLGPDGIWRHFDHEQPEPGPDERREYKCDMTHYPAMIMPGPLPEIAGLTPDRIVGRVELGHPGVGVGIIPPQVVWDPSTWSQHIPNVRTALARRIVDRHLPRALEHFLQRNAEYGDDAEFELGIKGQYPDISRKVKKLKRRWWEDEEPKAGEESDETIVMELIGHLLMSLDYMAGGENAKKQDTR